jgi:hypothetical protein
LIAVISGKIAVDQAKRALLTESAATGRSPLLRPLYFRDNSGDFIFAPQNGIAWTNKSIKINSLDVVIRVHRTGEE